MTSFFTSKATMYSLLVIVVVVAGFFLLNNTSYNLLGFASVPAYSSTTLGEDVVLELSSLPYGITVDVYSPEEKDFFVHKIVHYAKDDWASTELEALMPESQVGSWNDTWIRGAAQVTIESLPEGEYYVIAYVCQLYSLADFDDVSLTVLEREHLEEFFAEQEKQYLCGLTGIDADGIDHDNWLLANITVTGEEPFIGLPPPPPPPPGQGGTDNDTTTSCAQNGCLEEGNAQCVNEQNYRVCELQEQGCLGWSAQTSCATGKVCDEQTNTCKEEPAQPAEPLSATLGWNVLGEVVRGNLSVRVTGITEADELEGCVSSTTTCSTWEPITAVYSSGLGLWNVNFETQELPLTTHNAILRRGDETVTLSFTLVEILQTNCQGLCWQQGVVLPGPLPPPRPISELAPRWNYEVGYACSDEGASAIDAVANGQWKCLPRE